MTILTSDGGLHEGAELNESQLYSNLIHIGSFCHGLCKVSRISIVALDA